jgi:DNA-binding response OmpR family regulator
MALNEGDSTHHSPCRIVLFSAATRGEGEFARALKVANGENCVVAMVPLTCEAVDDGIVWEEQDVAFVDLGADDTGLDVIVAIRKSAPHLPLIAIERGGEETRAIEALKAGAQDCLSAAELQGPSLLRAIRYAIERSRFQARLDESHDYSYRQREMVDLATLAGPASLKVTERSLGSGPVAQRAPDHFDILVLRYGEVLDRSLAKRGNAEVMTQEEELHEIADRLGVLRAGPRDVVDVHKAAVNARLDDVSERRNRAYIDEGRLLLVQLMGHLVSFYRSFAWGFVPSTRIKHANPADVPVIDASTGKRAR